MTTLSTRLALIVATNISLSVCLGCRSEPTEDHGATDAAPSSTSGTGAGGSASTTGDTAAETTPDDTSTATTIEEPTTGELPECGDGILDSGEECEPNVKGDATCESVLGQDWVGPVGCSATDDCSFDTAGCEQLVEGAYYVAPDGDDDAPGSLDAPWQTWQHALDSAAPGDVIYLRGGTYQPQQRVRSNVNGTASGWITVSGYPGEGPILDCGQVDSVSCLSLDQSSYVVIRRITVQNLWQKTPADDLSAGFEITRSHDMRVESVTVHDIGAGCFFSSDNDELVYSNCDAFNCVDHLSKALPGNDGTGFLDGTQVIGATDGNVYYEGCRAWECGDQGFSSGSSAATHYRECWSFDNGLLEGAGHGFKMGWVPNPTPGVLNRTYRNSIAANNRRRGWDSNDQTYDSGILVTLNNFAYQNGCDDPDAAECANASHGFYVFNTNSSEAEELQRGYYNNASFDNEDGEVGVENGASYSHANNTWDSTVTVSEEDFVSLDTSDLHRPRRLDGSLPDIEFGHLAADSDLIDAGQVRDGYHCPMPGEHDDACIPWFGKAPDMGYAEFGA